MFCSETKVRVRYAETDQMGVVYHANYFQYFEVARAESIRNLGFTYADMERMNIMMPIVEVNCKYIRPALYDDLLTVKVILRELPKDHKILFQHEIFNEKNELLATGSVFLYFMTIHPQAKIKMPCELVEKLKVYFS